MSRRAQRVIHVTESYGGGVATAIGDYRMNYPDATHHLIYAPRSDAPVSPEDITDFETITELPSGHIRRVLALRRQLKSCGDVVVHAHSSFAGAYVRTAIRKTRQRPIVYTPHCYGFERRDVSIIKRAVFWILEWILAFNTSVFAGCSVREVNLSKWPHARARKVLVPNAAAKISNGISPVAVRSEALVVVGAGRLGPQKDPAYFRDWVLALQSEGCVVDARWIGGGDPQAEKLLKDSQISVTGWLPRTEVLEQMKKADVYIHSASWEGFPLAVLESSALGVATLVRDIPAFANLPPEIKTDFNQPSHFVDRMSDPASAQLWKQQNLAVWQDVLRNNTHQRQGESLKDAYTC